MTESYNKLRSRYNPNDARSNGYRSHAYFKKEQSILLDELNNSPEIILDIACGSGLMLIPLLKTNVTIIGIDLDINACVAAKGNSLKMIRGSVYSMPIASEMIDYAVSCQFLNQQPRDSIIPFLEEAYRVLKKGGKITLIWRNGNALIHRIATCLYKVIDKVFNNQEFPYFNHTILEVENQAENIGFNICTKEVIFPSLSWRSKNTNSILSKVIGASCLLTIEK